MQEWKNERAENVEILTGDRKTRRNFASKVGAGGGSSTVPMMGGS